MRLTIIPSDGAVYINQKAYLPLVWEGTPTNVHALQWDQNAGWVEYNDGTPNEDITALPSWANNAVTAWEARDYIVKNPPPPPPPTAEENKYQAMGLLLETDWVNEPDVTDPNLIPHLLNKDEFDAYRLELRKIAVSPTAGYIEWPVKPAEQWYLG